MVSSIVKFICSILAALLAGISLGIWIGMDPSGISGPAFVEQHQNLVGSLNVMMVSMVIIATVITIISAFQQKKNRPVFIALLFAALSFIGCILISRFGNKPIDDVIMTWKPESLPADWTTLRDNWRQFHIMRTMTELIALVLITWTNIRK